MLIRYSLADEGIRPSMFCSKDLKNMYRIWKCRIVLTFLIFQQFSAWHPRSWWWDECVIKNISGLISLISVTSCPNSSFWEMIRSQRSWKIKNIRPHSNHIYYITLTTCTIYKWIIHNTPLVQIRDGDQGYSPLIDKFCGSSFPPIITSSGGSLWLRWHDSLNIMS